MNYKGILFFLGIYTLFVSILSFLNILYSIYFNFFLDINSYFFTLAISLILGISFCFIGSKNTKNISLSDQIILIVLSFLFIPSLIAIPYFLSIYNINFLNSYFESVSGFTTTGFSIIKNIENIDQPLLLWRSSSQWLGGLFFLIATIGTLSSKQIKIKPLYLIPDSSYGGNFYNTFSSNFFRILLLYFLSTIFIIFLFTLSKVRLLDSFHLAFTVVSSGGFLPKSNFTNIIKDNLQMFVLSIAFLIPIFNFYLWVKIFTKKIKIRDHQEDVQLIVLIIISTFLSYFLINPSESILNTLVSVVSSLATSGIGHYSGNVDISLFFIILTIIGGSLLSTSSGLKYIRIYILLKISSQEIYRLVKPINIFNRNLFNSDSQFDDQDIKIAFFVFISFVISAFILSCILTLNTLSFENSFKLSILTLTNTTTSTLFGIDNIIFFDLKNFTKIVLISFMVVGKIEIIGFLYLIKKFLFKE